MIVRDEAYHRGLVFYGRKTPSCHMFSNLPGEEGTAELVAFATSIGMQAKWIQNPGHRHEHFDIWGKRVADCDRAGITVVDRRESVRIWKSKG